jgi:hypothetical protein
MGDENPESEHQADDVHLIEVSKQASFCDAILQENTQKEMRFLTGYGRRKP